MYKYVAMLSESQWVSQLCPSASANSVGLPHLSGHTANICIPRDGIHGGLAILPRFLSSAETQELTRLVERRFGLPGNRVSYNATFQSVSIKGTWSSAIDGTWATLGTKLRNFPGVSSAREIGRQNEMLQLAATGRLSSKRKPAVHHDRNMGQHRVLTVLGYLGRQRPDGAHTLFPLFDVEGLAPRLPHVHAAVQQVRRAIASAPPRE